MLNPLHLRTLRTVLEAGSFRSAAKRLGYTTSAVSQQIAALERDLGVTLFERRPQQLVTTPAARQLNEYATELLSRITEIRQDMSAFAGGSRGRLALATFPSAGAQLLPRALARLMADQPRAEFTFTVGHSAMLADAVHKAEVDLALTYEYRLTPRSWPAGLRRHLLLDEELVVLLPAGHPLEGSAVLDLPALSDQRWVSGTPSSSSFENLHRACAAYGFRPQVHFHSDDYDVVRGVVRAGLGVALVPALALGIDRTIKMRRLAGTPLRRRAFLIRRAADPNPLLEPAIKAFRLVSAQFVRWTCDAFAEHIEPPLASVPHGLEHQQD